MKTLEFQAYLNSDSTLRVPAELAAQIQREQSLRVILLVPESVDDREWNALAAEQFLKGYADSDAVYDDLPAG